MARVDPVAIVAGETIELAREGGANSRSVGLTLGKDGAVKVDLYDRGPLVEAMKGDSDYERWCSVPAEESGRLATALLHALFAEDAQAVDQFKAFCDAYGIASDFAEWS